MTEKANKDLALLNAALAATPKDSMDYFRLLEEKNKFLAENTSSPTQETPDFSNLPPLDFSDTSIPPPSDIPTPQSLISLMREQVPVTISALDSGAYLGYPSLRPIQERYTRNKKIGEYQKSLQSLLSAYTTRRLEIESLQNELNALLVEEYPRHASVYENGSILTLKINPLAYDTHAEFVADFKASIDAILLKARTHGVSIYFSKKGKGN